METRTRNALLRIVAMFAVLLVAYIAGRIASSTTVFLVVLAVGLVGTTALRVAERLRRRS